MIILSRRNTKLLHNQKDFSIALNDPNLTEIRNWLLNIKRIRDPRSHADETFPVDENTYNMAKFYCQNALARINTHSN